MGSRRRRDGMGPNPSDRREGPPLSLQSEGEPSQSGQVGETMGEPAEPRMMCLTIPCPRCGRFVAAMALEGVLNQRLALASHNAPDGTDCSKRTLILPRIPTERDERYGSLEEIHETITPAEKEHHPPAPEVEASMIERLGMYAAACPFSSLVRLFMHASDASEAMWRVSGVIDPEAVSESDHFATRIEDVEDVLREALADRLREGLERLDVDPTDRTISFRDPAGDEFVHMPLAALRVTPMASSYFEPGELPDEPDEDEGPEDED